MALGSLKHRARSPSWRRSTSRRCRQFSRSAHHLHGDQCCDGGVGAKITLPRWTRRCLNRARSPSRDPGGEIFVNTDPSSYDELEAQLRGLLSARPDIPVVLEGDREVLFGEAVRILSIAQKAGHAGGHRGGAACGMTGPWTPRGRE